MQFIDLKKQYEVLKTQIDSAIGKVLSEAHFIGGKEVSALASELATYTGAKHCLTCANGTDALTLALRCFDVKAGDAVFVPTFTFFSSAESVALEGAQCIFVDSCERTFNMDAEKLDKAISEVIKQGKLTPKCIIAVDLFGQCADYTKIRKVADKYNLPIIEDGAQGFGGSINGKKACSFGHISTTSFFPAKPLGCYGDGGAVFTDSDEHYAMLSSLAVHGKGSYKYDNVRIGYNSRLDTVQAAVLLVKLKAFKEYELKARNEVAEKYTKALCAKFKTPVVPDGFVSSWAQYTLILQSAEQREHIQAKMKEQSIPTMVYYPICMHKQTAFKGYDFNLGDLTVAENLSQRVLSLPMHPYLTDEEIDKIVNALYNC